MVGKSLIHMSTDLEEQRGAAMPTSHNLHVDDDRCKILYPIQHCLSHPDSGKTYNS